MAIAVMTSAYVAWRVVDGVVPREGIFRLYGFLMAIVVISWLVTDPKIPFTQRPSFDHGLFIWISFPLLAAYHLYTARRWRGLLMILGLLGLMAAPHVTLAIAAPIG